MRTAEPRWVREVRVLCEYWLLPLVVALLPYRAGIALAQRLAARLPLYGSLTDASWEACRDVQPTDERLWKSEFRLTQLLDHADLFWSLTRSDAWILARMSLPKLDPWPPGGLLAIGFHYGEGLWLLRWMRASGKPARFLSVRFARPDFDSWFRYAYARLRMRAVEAAEGAPPIYTGGGRQAIAETLEAGGCVFGLVDVAVEGASGQNANGRLFGRPIFLPEGVLDSACAANPPVLSVSARHDALGIRQVEARLYPSARDVTMSTFSAELQWRLDAASAAWHSWAMWPRFLARETASS
jgi:hypothetical protein